MAEFGKGLDELDLKHSAGTVSAWSPLQEPLFRSLWLASVVSYIGTWMQNVGAGWLMTSLTTSPLMVSLVQAASALPVFLVILPAGALADMIDRRRLLIVTQTWMVVAAAALGILTLFGIVTPWMILGFTFLLGLGAVMNDPAWQAITPEVISQRRFEPAVALNSAGYNVARAVGPALGGLIIAAVGTGATFLLNAASFFGVIYFLYRWKRMGHEQPRRTEKVLDAIRTGIQHVRQAPAVQSVLVRTALFSFAASALLAMLPLIARPHGSVGYGALLAFFGLGALSGAAILPALRRRVSANAVVGWGTLVFAASTSAAGYAQTFWLLCLVLFAGGTGWIAIVATLNVSAQTMCPSWLRARALSMYLLVLQGGMAAGSACWGGLADRVGIETALVVAAVVLVMGLLTIRRHPLRAEGFELTPSVNS